MPTAAAASGLDCQVSQDVLDCGELLRVDLGTGVNQVTTPAAWEVTSPQPQASPAATADQGLTTNTGEGTAEGASPATTRPTAPAAQVSASGTPDPRASSATTAPTAPATGTGAWTRVTGSATTEVPLALDDEGGLTVDGEAVSGLSLGGERPVWAAPVEVPRRLAGMRLPVTREVWVVGDGEQLAVVDGPETLWVRDLPEGTADLTGATDSAPPEWLVDSGAVVLAEPEGIIALDPETGTTLWTVTTPVTSWAASDGTIVVVSGATASVLSFETTSPSSTALPTSGPDSEEALDLEAIRNATLEVPELCMPAASQEGGATFVDGVASSTEAGVVPATATMKEVIPGVFDSRPVAVVVMSCSGGGNTGFDVLAVYSQADGLLGELDLVTSGDVGTTPNLLIEEVHAVGETITLTVPSIQVAGDDSCQACEGSASATVTARWDGESLGIVDVVYSLPSGSLRIPATEDVQAAYDAIASGEAEEAEQYMSPELAAELDVTLGAQGSTDTVRSLQFPEGGSVVSCALAAPGLDTGTYSAPGVESGTEALDPGAVICPVTSDDPALPWLAPQQDQYGNDSYLSWLILEADESGDFRVTGFGRAFG
ncbi:hypothetical protein [Actinomyces howellii]|uniref:hypothetical protein n=1 Tax=Actinomyces howellii TaxID=52771 RepID=UPI000F8328E8|nr:hypothetical protein [Actinomyces howellii]